MQTFATSSEAGIAAPLLHLFSPICYLLCLARLAC